MFMVGLFFSVFYTMQHFTNESVEMQQQEDFGEDIANEYLIHISQNEPIQTETTPAETDPSDLDYIDNEIYKNYSEKYAHGRVDCVVEIPAIDLRQSVFTGTPAQIEHDLSRWLSVTARADYMLGNTHYCIYMHNPRDKSIQISKAQEILKTNDYVVITKEQNVYLYQIVDIFAEWRNKCTEKYVDNMSVDNDLLYIFTCGRDEWQGRNLVIKGQLYEMYQLQDWNSNKDAYINSYKKDVNNIPDPPKKPQPMQMSISTKTDNILYINIIGPQYEKIYNCTIGICDIDGYLIDNGTIDYNAEIVETPPLKNGEYYIGIYENGTEFADPTPYKITISQKETTVIETVDAVADTEEANTQTIRLIAIALLMLTFFMGCVVIIKIIKE